MSTAYDLTKAVIEAGKLVCLCHSHEYINLNPQHLWKSDTKTTLSFALVADKITENSQQ